MGAASRGSGFQPRNGLAAKTVFREVQTVDIALTLSRYLKIKAPYGATGSPLSEVLDQ